MYNHQLDMFIKAVQTGSFTQAAEQSYLSTTAAIKQINVRKKTLESRCLSASIMD